MQPLLALLFLQHARQKIMEDVALIEKPPSSVPIDPRAFPFLVDLVSHPIHKEIGCRSLKTGVPIAFCG